MGELTIVSRKQELVQLSPAEQLADDCAPYLDEFQYLDNCAPPKAREAAIAFFCEKEPELQQLVAKIEALLVPATRREIGNCLATLTACYPNAGKTDLRIYGALLLEDVSNLRPSCFVVDCACRKLRCSLKFLPTIAEVIEAVNQEQRELRLLLRRFKEEVPRLTGPVECM